MKVFLSQLNKGVVVVFNWTAVITSVILVGLVTFSVISRYVFQWSIIGLNELALVAAMWLYMTGAMIASRRSEHLVVDFLPQKLTSPFWRGVHQRIIALIMVGASLFFIKLAWDMVGFALRLPSSTPGLGIPELIPKAALVLASVWCFGYALRDLITGNPCYTLKGEG